jgi:hypothetical protein
MQRESCCITDHVCVWLKYSQVELELGSEEFAHTGFRLATKQDLLKFYTAFILIFSGLESLRCPGSTKQEAGFAETSYRSHRPRS